MSLSSSETNLVGIAVGLAFVASLVVGALWVALDIAWWPMVFPLLFIVGAAWLAFVLVRRRGR